MITSLSHQIYLIYLDNMIYYNECIICDLFYQLARLLDVYTTHIFKSSLHFIFHISITETECARPTMSSATHTAAPSSNTSTSTTSLNSYLAGGRGEGLELLSLRETMRKLNRTLMTKQTVNF